MKYKFLVVLLVCFISIGYSALSNTLSISADAKFQIRQFVDIIDVTVYDEKNGNSVDYNFNDLTLDTTINMPNIDSRVTYEITVLNSSEYNVRYKGVNDLGINATVIGLQPGVILEPGETRKFIITLYNDGIVLDNEINELEINFDFKITLQSRKLVTENLLLNINANDELYEGEIYDRSGNGNLIASNVTRDDTTNAFVFSGDNSCALSNRSILPESGDFSLEIELITGGNILGDQSVVAQKFMNNTVEKGRTKPFNIYNNSLRLFLNGSEKNSTYVPNYVEFAEKNTSYHLFVTRRDNVLRLYLNSVLLYSETINTGDKISTGTFQIGCYNSINSQNFIGKINFVRVYDKGLSQNEIINNYMAYREVEQFDESLYNHLINNKVTTGDGLYDIGNKYVFKGKNPDNYFYFLDNLYRIISIENDKTMKLVKVSSVKTEIPFDKSGYRNTLNNPYCTHATTDAGGGEYFGCNLWSTFDNMTTQNSSLLDYLNNDFYNSVHFMVQDKILERTYNVGPVKSYLIDDVINEEKELTWTGKVGTLVTSDVLLAGFDGGLTTTDSNNYLKNLSNEYLNIWTMNGLKGSSYDVQMVIRNSVINPRRASRTSQNSGSIVIKYGVVPVFNISSDIFSEGNGTMETPYTFLE